MQRPVLDGYDVIFIDEAQDCTPGTDALPGPTFSVLFSVEFEIYTGKHPPVTVCCVGVCLCFFSVIMDIVLSQSCGKMLVGDPHQQIYTFRGAVNALYIVPHTHLYYLTQVQVHIYIHFHITNEGQILLIVIVTKH